LYDSAADLETTSLRSLDAIHLAAARTVGPDLAGVVTYDARMAEAAAALDLHVEASGFVARRSIVLKEYAGCRLHAA
jgi:hypothetical protein